MGVRYFPGVYLVKKLKLVLDSTLQHAVSMGDFLVAFHLSFKASLSAKPFIRKLVLFTSCSETEAKGNSEIEFLFLLSFTAGPPPRDRLLLGGRGRYFQESKPKLCHYGEPFGPFGNNEATPQILPS